jgi:hypothetical protein
MQFKEWLKENGRTLQGASKETGIAYQRLSGIKTGRIEPRLIEAAKLYDYTGGDVTLQDWIGGKNG